MAYALEHPQHHRSTGVPLLPLPEYTLWVGNLPHHATEEMVTRLFGPVCKVVRFKLIRDHGTNRSRCFGFLTVATERDALKLLDASPNTYRLARRGLKIAPAHKGGAKFVKKYKAHEFSDEPYDMRPAHPTRPCIHVLNDDTLMCIFDRLVTFEIMKLERVCRRWQGIVYRLLSGRTQVDFVSHSDDWNLFCLSPFLSPHLKQQDASQLKMIMMNCSTLTAIHLGRQQNDNIPTIDAIGQLAKQLETFSIVSYSYNQNLSLAAITSGCPKLREITIKGPFKNENYLADLKLCQNLESLELFRSKDLKDGMEDYLPRTLTTLILDDFFSFSPATVKAIASLQNLTTLGFTPKTRSSCYSFIDEPNAGHYFLSQEILDTLADGCKKLDSLTLSSNTVTPANFSFKNFHNLTILTVSFRTLLLETFINPDVLPPQLLDLRIIVQMLQVMEHNPDFSKAPATLQSITLPKITLSEAAYISITKMPNIRTVYCHSGQITMDSIIKLASCPKIEELCAYRAKLNADEMKRLVNARKRAVRSLPDGEAVPPPLSLLISVSMITNLDAEKDKQYLKVTDTYGHRYLRQDGSQVIIGTPSEASDDDDDYDDDEDDDEYYAFDDDDGSYNSDEYDNYFELEDLMGPFGYDSHMEDMWHVVNYMMNDYANSSPEGSLHCEHD